MAKLEIKWFCSENFWSSDMNRDFFIGWYLAETRGLSFRNTVIFLRNLKAIEKVIWSLVWGFFFFGWRDWFFYIVVKIAGQIYLWHFSTETKLSFFPPFLLAGCTELYLTVSLWCYFFQFRTFRANLKHSFSQFSQPAQRKMICQLVKHQLPHRFCDRKMELRSAPFWESITI